MRCRTWLLSSARGLVGTPPRPTLSAFSANARPSLGPAGADEWPDNGGRTCLPFARTTTPRRWRPW
eukprot:11179200-Lingulodinium_polyedra.AAC.1